MYFWMLPPNNKTKLKGLLISFALLIVYEVFGFLETNDKNKLHFWFDL